MSSIKFCLSIFISLCYTLPLSSAPGVELGIDRLFEEPYVQQLRGKRVALCTNHTALSSSRESAISLIKRHAKRNNYKVVALFGPEHGINGAAYAEAKVGDSVDTDGVPVFSLHGKTRRPTKKMLQGIQCIVFDMQDIGSRSYTYISTLFYLMEEAAKEKIEVIVCDRPNPINGVTIDGPMLDNEWRSYVSYINVPYIHGMTIAELAQYFNTTYKVGCKLSVVPMRGWRRSMSFKDTGLTWVPTSPHIPESDTPLFYPMTGILGELQILSIGIGYTLPFKVVGAPWIDKDLLAKQLNRQNFPGVYFQPFSFKPFFGRYAKEVCHGVLIHVTNTSEFKPVSTQYLILGILKSMYRSEFVQALNAAEHRKAMFCKVNGTQKVYDIMRKDRYIVWKLRAIHEERRKKFTQDRKRFLLKEYPL